MSVVVSNTSPLIVLAKAGLLELLPQLFSEVAPEVLKALMRWNSLELLPKLFSEVAVPEAVRDEIMAGGDDDEMKRALPNRGWLRAVVLAPPLSPLAAMQLGRGEAEAIEYARRQTDCAILLDDRAGRRTAQALGLRLFGTLSVVAAASQQGYISSFDEALQRLRNAGLYVSEAVVDAVRRGLLDTG